MKNLKQHGLFEGYFKGYLTKILLYPLLNNISKIIQYIKSAEYCLLTIIIARVLQKLLWLIL